MVTSLPSAPAPFDGVPVCAGVPDEAAPEAVFSPALDALFAPAAGLPVFDDDDVDEDSGFEVWSFEADDGGEPDGELGVLGLLGEEVGGGVGGVGCDGGVAQAASVRQATTQRLWLRLLFMRLKASICRADLGRHGRTGVSCTVAESC